MKFLYEVKFFLLSKFTPIEMLEIIEVRTNYYKNLLTSN